MGTITTPKAYQGPSRVADPYTGGVFTKHGWFSYGELDASEAKYTTDRNGRQVVQFPFSREAGGRPMYREIPAWVLREHDEREQREEPDRAAD